ncbi:hypothetical protein CC1G_15621 [Coprinopsis cinerea okayama7|uniref:Uncharacterized protein n=1 Tax=Coprinopsis cinerea (strain Okayama-7 / 130 / ATCC MYA-4618 / FGSC 9003) TaxID=240176 RepID=D6RNF1_COPC7|nr:hypothetical protein CC1G_15621 [Coprinopsis cinerea okayama7\|eukprot:XP_002911079.1 hypothetical protein CC1G_15621 [Coprinopsis cinerea okayama7\
MSTSNTWNIRQNLGPATTSRATKEAKRGVGSKHLDAFSHVLVAEEEAEVRRGLVSCPCSDDDDDSSGTAYQKQDDSSSRICHLLRELRVQRKENAELLASLNCQARMLEECEARISNLTARLGEKEMKILELKSLLSSELATTRKLIDTLASISRPSV